LYNPFPSRGSAQNFLAKEMTFLGLPRLKGRSFLFYEVQDMENDRHNQRAEGNH
jgi:hypothetical protein